MMHDMMVAKKSLHIFDAVHFDEVAAGDAGEPAGWHKAKPIVLGPHTTAEEALTEAVNNFLNHCGGNEACVRGRAHDEGVHQMRVSVRRLRSRLGLYKGLLPDFQRRHANRELRWLISELGPARDWDVFLAETLKPVRQQFPDENGLILLRDLAERQQDAGYVRAEAAIRSERYRSLMPWITAWSEEHGWWDDASNDDGAKGLLVSATDLATRRLDVLHREILERGRDFASLDAEARHRLRILGKKLRYATEFFESLFPAERTQPFLKALKALQDGLGAMNDIAVARTLALDLARNADRKKLRLRLAYAAGLVISWYTHVKSLDGDVEGAWAAFAASPPCWK